MKPETQLTVQLKHESIYAQHNIGRFRLSLTAGDKPTLQDQGLPDAVVAALKIGPNQRNAEQKKALADYYRTIDPELTKLRQQVAQAETEKANLQQVASL